MKMIKAREAIMRAAARLFYKQGYCNTGVNQIIVEANIARATLYQHFPSKEDILVVYLDEIGRRTVNGLKEATEKGGTPGDKVIELFDFWNNL